MNQETLEYFHLDVTREDKDKHFEFVSGVLKLVSELGIDIREYESCNIRIQGGQRTVIEGTHYVRPPTTTVYQPNAIQNETIIHKSPALVHFRYVVPPIKESK